MSIGGPGLRLFISHIVEIEKELAEAKTMVEKLENDIVRQSEASARDMEQIQQFRSQCRRLPGSPIHKRKTSGNLDLPPPPPDGVPKDYVSPTALAEHRARVAILEEELEEERKLRREADGEIIKLRAAINGVKRNEDDFNALLSPQVGGECASGVVSEESSMAEECIPPKRYVHIVFCYVSIISFNRRSFSVTRVCL